ncbi:MAG: hypothetical protein U9R43_03070 [Thermodesulfobacteriota bacterium]|nr:hypothetical protein [Thermodesulfobacteriota bacterium]
MFNRKEFRFVGYSMAVLFTFLCLAAVMACQGCAITKTVDWRKLDTPTKRYHFAQLSFKDMQKDYIAIFPTQPEETKAYLRENVAPVLHNTKLALDAWADVVLRGAINAGQESAFTELIDNLILLLRPYLQKEGKE